MNDQRWYKGCKTKAEREQRKKELISYRPAFDSLLEMMECLKKPSASRDYSEGQGWVYKQIAYNEYNQVLRDIQTLIKES